MRLEGIRNKFDTQRLKEAYKEALCFTFVICGLIMLQYFLDYGLSYDPTEMQNWLILTIGVFSSYVFLVNTFFGNERNKIIGRHIILVTIILSVIGIITLVIYFMEGHYALDEIFTYSSSFTNGIMVYFIILMFLLTIMFYVHRGEIKETKSVENEHQPLIEESRELNEINEVEEEE
ncbi:MAG: hypothetical protein ACFFB5_15025 [Promethearchaeota archaeon]